MLAECLGMSRTELYVAEEPLNRSARATLEAWCALRLRGLPLQYVLGTAEFCGHRLRLTPSVFIPRPETEVLVEAAVGWLSRRAAAPPVRGRVAQTPSLWVLDVGVGSGSISISLAKAVARCVLVGIELSWGALEIARANVEAHGLRDRIWLLQGDLVTAIRRARSPQADGPPSGREGWVGFEVIISNPPYVETDSMQALPAEGRAEPRLSLDGGADGMRAHRGLVAESGWLLRPGGVLAMECAEDQAGALAALAARTPWARRVTVLRDLADRPRVVWAEARTADEAP